MASTGRLVVMGVVVHLLLLRAVFDIYFVSPIHRGMTPHRSGGIPPARRIVLFVADGLRAASLYGPQMAIRAPYLSSIVNNTGSWGVSHTQVPTESRPGHIAILAGFNEDPSAITRGWKSNPVDFDSVINQSTNAWCWGSPDIVDIFNKDNLSHIHLSSYDAYMQDFSGKISTTLLDEWVFDKVNAILEEQKQVGCTDFCEDGNVFFLHLLGLDTAGHSYKPETTAYVKNIKVVDDGIETIVAKFENFFKDKQTAYVFTADHGMTNWGSHGDGSEHETDVPFIAWGAGVAKNVTRQDVLQADIAPFISSLVGINIPINSVGVVPLHYLRTSIAQKANILHANAHQLAEQYFIKHRSLKAHSIPWTFQRFSRLTEKMFNEKTIQLNFLTENEEYEEIIRQSYILIDLCKEGLKYYYRYYQNTLLLFVTLGFIGWIVYLFISIKDLGTHIYNQCVLQVRFRLRSSTIGNQSTTVCAVITVIFCLFILGHSLPFKYYIYCIFPICTWCSVVKNYEHCLIKLNLLSTFPWRNLLWKIIGYAIGIELLTMTFFERKYLSFLIMYFAWQSLINRRIRFNMSQWVMYVLGYLWLGFCPLVMEMQTEFNYISLVMSWSLWYTFQFLSPFVSMYTPDKRVIGYQFHILSIAFLNSITVHISITRGAGLLLINQLTSWALLIAAMVMPVFTSTCLENKITSIIIALITPYTLMGIGYEHLFMFLLSQHVMRWISAEYAIQFDDTHLPLYQTTSVSALNYTDHNSVRRCFYLLSYIVLSYFGVGNTASMNSFDPLWVRCFVTVFSPFTMAGLILVKLIIPFLIVLCAFRAIMLITMAQTRNTFLIILVFCDIMVLHLLYYVQNEGSWLEIGVSLSRFIVVNVTTIVLMVLYQIACHLTLIPSGAVLKYLPDIVIRQLQKSGIIQ